jgi:tetratricopeptide (TPR) repeat protein
MFLRCMGLLILAAACSIPAPAQSLVAIERDLRVFTTLAALNVSGFDVELGAQYHPIRAEIRKLADTLDPVLLQKLRDFYSTHKGGRPDEEQLAKYISLAVVLTDPPELKPVGREESLPNEARSVLGFAELLREFYQKAAISRQWSRLEAAYDAEMDRLGPPIRDTLTRTDAYIRAASTSTAGQTMRITVELAAPLNSVNVRSHQDSYFVVLGYAPTLRMDEIRHAYLHLRLNNAVQRAAPKLDKRSTLTALIAREQGVAPEYAGSFENLLAESLIRAVELRMDRPPAARTEEAIRNYYRSGLLLTPYFHTALAMYEQAEGSLPGELDELVKAIDIGKEQARFEQTFSSIPLPERTPLRAEVPVAPRIDPVMDLLLAAQAAFAKDKPRARELFDRVLSEHDPNNGRAFYGIALIEMDKGPDNHDKALEYFDKTIKSTSADPSMKTWSYIYTGHILDFRCQRAAAVENYRKAIQTGDNSQNAQGTAERDLAKPFGGGECPQ